MAELEELSSIELRLVTKATNQHVPIYGIMELSPLCNMNCDMCYVRLSKEEVNQKGRIRTVDEWLSIAREMAKQGVMFILLTGGEPLLYPHFKELYKALKNMGMILTINTNGTLINEEWADFFMNNKPRRVNITLYGSNNNTYERLCHYKGYDQTIRAIELLNERGVSVKINGSLTPTNQEEGLDIIKYAKETNTYCEIDTYMYPSHRERNKPFNEQSRLLPEIAAYNKYILEKEYYDNYEEHVVQSLTNLENTKEEEPIPSSVQCRAGRSSFIITWEGNMRPCVMMNEPSINVFDHGFNNSWNYIVEETSKIKVSGECNGCKKRNVCPTCAACSKLETGSYEETPKYLCKYTDKLIELWKKQEA